MAGKIARGAILAFVSLLVACASGSALVTGERRPATSPEQVQLYLEPPAVKFEVIGLVEASSDSGWTKQGDLDYAVKELKKQAAKLGANGVLIETRGSKSSGAAAVPIGNSWYAVSSEEQTISGRAIWIDK